MYIERDAQKFRIPYMDFDPENESTELDKKLILSDIKPGCKVS